MNHAYRLVWNQHQQRQVPAAEHARGRGKSSAVKPLAAALLSALALPALALPQGGMVTGGSGNIQQQGSTLTVNQTTQQANLSWQSFNIANGETVNFVQPNASAVAVNRVLGNDPSAIFGKLNANGQVFLINPNGVLFGKGAEVNVGGLVASTLDTTDGRRFAGKAGSVVNEGSIHAADSGYVALLGGQVSNGGVITARAGSVALGAGEDMTLDFAGDQLVNLRIDKGTVGALVDNHQLIQAQGGQVLMSARATDAVLNAVVNQTGIIEATGIDGNGGLVKLAGDLVAQTGSIDVSGKAGGSVGIDGDGVLLAGNIKANGSLEGGSVVITARTNFAQTSTSTVSADGGGKGGQISLDGGKQAYLSGTLAATGTQGGTVAVLGDNITLNSASVDASGQGGKLYVGGGFHGQDANLRNATNTTVNAFSTLKVDGDGSQAVVWSDQQTNFAGTLTTGTNSQAEVSGKQNLNFSGQAHTGQGGNLLLDPTNLTITNTVGDKFYIDLADPNPQDGVGHGNSNYAQLSNGNIVVSDPNAMTGSVQGGGVFLYNGQTGALISAIYGGTTGDQIGSAGIQSLAGSNTVFGSPYWSNGATSQVGAVTWMNGTTGLSGFVTAANSIIGSTANDHVGLRIGQFNNGNYFFGSPDWSNGGASQAGALTFGYANQATSGVVSVANSLVGSTTGDRVGDNLMQLSQGNAIAWTGTWSNGANANAGAVTWLSQSAPIVGTISAANSMVGSNTNDHVGMYGSLYNQNGVNQLSNGNVLVFSQHWDNDAGAVTWMSGSSATSGTIGSSNSVVGDTAGEAAGYYTRNLSIDVPGLYELSNGNVAVVTEHWSSGGTISDAGAVTWMSGTSPTAGVISAANSIVGSAAGDKIGQGRDGSGSVVPLTNGNYVVLSPSFHNGATANAGAVTWGNGTGATGLTVDATNSLVGSTDGDRVSSNGVTALTNGNYVVNSPYWSNGANSQVGAATWGNGEGGTVGTISAANSLVGTDAGDHVGLNTTLALSNGNYVVLSPDWNDSADGHSGIGAITWGNGNGSTVGSVSTGNSMYGDNDGDHVGNTALALPGGSYLVNSSGWHGTGAVAWRDGSTANTGTLDSTNAMTGTQLASFKVLSNGKFVVYSQYWGSYQGYIAVGSNDGSFKGTLDQTNALFGDEGRNLLAGNGIVDLGNGNFVAISGDAWGPSSKGAAALHSGAFTFMNSNSPVVGLASASNTFYGSGYYDRLTKWGFTVLPNHDFVVPSPLWDGVNGSTPNVGAVVIGSGTTGLAGYVSSSNAIIGTANNSYIGQAAPYVDGITLLSGNNFLIRSGMANVDGHANAGALWLVHEDADFASTVNNSAGNQSVSPGAIANAALSGTTLTLQASNNITVNSAISVDGALNLQAGGALTLNAGITSQATGNAIVLKGGSFVNNVGVAALSTPNGHWQVWSSTPTGDTVGGLAFDFKQYGATYGSSSVLGTGNGLFYSVAPTLNASLTGSASKVYDGTTSASTSGLDIALNGLFSGDSASVSGPTSAHFSDKNAGSGKTVTASGVTVGSVTSDGKPVYGYTLGTTSLSANIGTIEKATLTVSGVTVDNKVYDATTTATLGGLATLNAIKGDQVSLNGLTASFTDKNVGQDKAVTLTGYTLAGADAGNYTLVLPSGLKADITPATLNLGGLTVVDKVYDGTTSATLAGGSIAALGQDQVSLVNGTANFGDKNVGEGKTVTVSGFKLAGADAANYVLAMPNSVTGNITPATLVLSGLIVGDKVYDGTTSATLGGAARLSQSSQGQSIASGPVVGDDVHLGGSGNANFADAHAGDSKAVTIEGYTLSGADAANYRLLMPSGLTASITPATLTVTANDDTRMGLGKPYAGGNGVVYSGFKGGDTVGALGGALAYGGTAQGATAPGVYTILPSGLSSSDYVFDYEPGRLTLQDDGAYRGSLASLMHAGSGDASESERARAALARLIAQAEREYKAWAEMSEGQHPTQMVLDPMHGTGSLTRMADDSTGS